MNDQPCKSQKSLNSIRKWLLQAGDGLSPTSPWFCFSSSNFHQNIKLRSSLNKTNKRKRLSHRKYSSKTTSIINWFYQFIKKVFTVYDENPQKSSIYETTRSIMSCSTCLRETDDAYINTIESTLKSSKSNSILLTKINPDITITSETSNCNLNTSQSFVLQTQTQISPNEEQSTIYPGYCVSENNGQTLPLEMSSSSSITVIPIVKEITCCSSPFYLLIKNSEHFDKIPTVTKDICSYYSYQPTITSIPSSHSNIISLQPTQYLKEDKIFSKIYHSSTSLHDTSICHCNKHDCLIECYHYSNIDKSSPSHCHRVSTINTDTCERIFAENTCQLIQQAWNLSTSHH